LCLEAAHLSWRVTWIVFILMVIKVIGIRKGGPNPVTNKYVFGLILRIDPRSNLQYTELLTH
jgi:hypothetical protein